MRDLNKSAKRITEDFGPKLIIKEKEDNKVDNNNEDQKCSSPRFENVII